MIEVTVLYDGSESEATVETSNPGPHGSDTGYEFVSPKTGGKIRVMRKETESREEAIKRVKSNHGLG